MLKPQYDQRLAIKPSLSIAMLVCLFVFFLIAMSLIMQFLMSKMNNQIASLRIMAVIQDVFMFIIPAIATAMVSTRLPAWLLRIDRFPSSKLSLVTLGVMIASIPAMNVLVEWNSNITLPESMHDIAVQMKEMENAAEASINMMLSGNGIMTMIIGIMIIGVFAGFSEEIFFRGALQRFIAFSANPHVAIWLTAFIFSAIHFQFFGFVPRLLLGAFFGYLVWWSGSLWLAVYAHVFNNSMVVIFKWLENNKLINTDFDTIGANCSSVSDIIMVAVSLCLIIIGVIAIRRIASVERSQKKL